MGIPKVATVWFEGCSGCHMSFLDLDEDLAGILSKVELTFTPITDFKDYAFPELDVGIIEGGIGNDEHLEVAHKLRTRCKILVAWGDCAVFGGVNTLRNWLPKAEVLRRGYVETESTVDGVIPVHEELPPLLELILQVREEGVVLDAPADQFLVVESDVGHDRPSQALRFPGGLDLVHRAAL